MADSEVNSTPLIIVLLPNRDHINLWLFYWQVLKKLKDIPFKIQTASLKGRREVVEEIQNVLSTPGKYYLGLCLFIIYFKNVIFVCLLRITTKYLYVVQLYWSIQPRMYLSIVLSLDWVLNVPIRGGCFMQHRLHLYII